MLLLYSTPIRDVLHWAKRRTQQGQATKREASSMHEQVMNMDYDQAILIFLVKCIKVCSQQGTCKVTVLLQSSSRTS